MTPNIEPVTGTNNPKRVTFTELYLFNKYCHRDNPNNVDIQAVYKIDYKTLI